MDKKRSWLNVFIAIFFRMILIMLNLMVRRSFIRLLGNDINGINALYHSIIGVLSVAELGIGDAIIYCMYRPIVEGDNKKVSALYRLFQRLYLLIGIVVALAGCVAIPFLPGLAKGYPQSGINLSLTFGLMLSATVLSYFFGAKTALMNAYRDNYIATTIRSLGQVIQQVLQILILYWTRSFGWYLVCQIVSMILQWVASSIIANKRYPKVEADSVVIIDRETKDEITKNIRAMFLHRVGGILVNAVDSILISAFVGVQILGKYSNYTAIVTAMSGTLTLAFGPLTSTIGHLFVTDQGACQRYYKWFYSLNYTLACVFFMGYNSVIDNLILILFGTGLELSRAVTFLITVNYFIQFMRQSTLTYRDAAGLFFYDRWKPIAEGGCNLLLSLVFVILFQRLAGDEFAVIGVIAATIVTNLLICHVVEPHIIYKYAFHKSAKKHYIRNYWNIAVFVVLLAVLDHILVTTDNVWLGLFLNGCIAVGISLIPILLNYLWDKASFRNSGQSNN